MTLLGSVLGACGNTVSTSQFSGEQHQVAQTIANLQSDVNSSEQQKICANDLASEVVARLQKSSGGCRQAIKEQLAEIDNSELRVESVTLGPTTAHPPSATARVASIYAGKTRAVTVKLLKQGTSWKVAAIE